VISRRPPVTRNLLIYQAFGVDFGPIFETGLGATTATKWQQTHLNVTSRGLTGHSRTL
jgi:hypothetical protein